VDGRGKPGHDGGTSGDLMCQACEEMDLFYAYLDAVEEAKRKAQPWQCEVTLIPQGDDVSAAAVPSASAKPSRGIKSGFSCDEPE